jgi:hypothetical protein
LTRGRVCHLQFLVSLDSAVILGSESRGTHDHILLSQIRDSTNLEGQVPAFISPRNRVARLYPQALGSLSVASYDSQGYGGGIGTRLHAGLSELNYLRLLVQPQHGPHRKHLSTVLLLLDHVAIVMYSVENTASQVRHCCVLKKLLPSNGRVSKLVP